MKTFSPRLKLILFSGLLIIAFQNCAPAEFSGDSAASEKAAGDTDDVDENSPPQVVEDVDDEELGTIPVVHCPKRHHDCHDDHDHVSIDADAEDKGEHRYSLGVMRGEEGGKEQKHMCAVICHYPGGDKAKGKTLYVGLMAVKAHVKNHGDKLGSCEE